MKLHLGTIITAEYIFEAFDAFRAIIASTWIGTCLSAAFLIVVLV